MAWMLGTGPLLDAFGLACKNPTTSNDDINLIATNSLFRSAHI